MMPTLRLAQHLESLTRDTLFELRQLLPGFGPADRYAKKAELAALFEAQLLDPERLKALWTALDEPTRRAINAAIADPATPGMLDVREYLVAQGGPPVRFVVLRDKYGHASDQKPTLLALFFDDDFRMPVDLANAFWTLLPDAHPKGKQTIRAFHDLPPVETYGNSTGKTVDLALTAVATEPHAFHDVLATLRMIEAGKIKINVNTLTPAQTSLKVLNGALSLREYAGTDGAASLRASEAIRTFGLITIAIGARWAVPDDEGRLMLTTVGAGFLSQPGAESLRDGFDAWLTSNVYDEVTRIGALRGALNAMAMYGTPPPIRRNALMQTLSALPGGHWIDVESLFRMVLGLGNDFEVETHDLSHLWIGAYGNWGNQQLGRTDSEVYWRVVKCQLMLALLFEPLACFGVVDVAYLPPHSGVFYRGLRAPASLGAMFSQYDVLRFVRITVLGQYLFGLTETYAAPGLASGPALRVLPNRQIVVASRMAGMAAGHPVLSKFCDQVSDDVYQLAPAKLIKTIEKHDMTVADVIAYLERESAAPLPQPVRVALEDVDKRGRLVNDVGSARLFQVDDAHLALELEHDRVLQRAGCRRSGDWIVVPADKVTAFRRRMRELGYAVKAA